MVNLNITQQRPNLGPQNSNSGILDECMAPEPTNFKMALGEGGYDYYHFLPETTALQIAPFKLKVIFQ